MEVVDAEEYCAAQFYSALTAGCEVLYILLRLGFGKKKPTPVNKDNTTCIERENEEVGGRERAK